MRTFGCGSRVIASESLEVALAINASLDQLEAARFWREHLRSVNHGHDFSLGYLCSCGMTLKAYRMECYGDVGMCPLFHQEHS